MGRKKYSQEYRHTSVRLEKELLTQFVTLCAKIGISYSTGLRWLIEEAVKKSTLQPPSQDTNITVNGVEKIHKPLDNLKSDDIQ